MKDINVKRDIDTRNSSDSTPLLLSSHTIVELKRLAEDYDTTVSAIIEMAVCHFSYSQKKGI